MKQTLKTLGQHRGFSLIELALVLLLIGIISNAIVRPKINDLMQTAALKSVATQVDLDLKVARNLALQSNLLYKVVFSASTTNYTIYSQHPTQDVWSVYKSAEIELDTILIKST